MVVHNHPSGELEPSEADRLATANVRAAATVAGLRFANRFLNRGVSPDHLARIESHVEDSEFIIPRAALEKTTVTASGVNWIACDASDGWVRVEAQIRHRHAAAPGRVRALPGDRAELEFDAPQWAVTPGQSAVLYRGDVCLGGGIIN